MNINFPLIEAIAAELEPYREDEQTYLDTLDGETDVLDILDGLLASRLDDEALAAAIKEQEADLRARRERVEMRGEAKRRLLGRVLSAMGQKSVERPRGTVSLRPGSVRVEIGADAEIPTQLCAPPKPGAPDKKAIKALLEAGEAIPGAQLVRGDDSISIRVA